MPGTQSSGPATTNRALRDFLGGVRPNLPLGESADILLELETTILDRADDRARREDREPTDDDLRAVVREMGDPDAIAASYAAPRVLVAPEAFRAFMLRAGMLFVVHMVLVGIVTALDHPIHVGLFPVEPIGPHGLLSVAAAACHAGLVDLGLMTAVYGVCGAYRGVGVHKSDSFHVDARPRAATGRAVLALLAALVLNVFRDGIFVIVVAGHSHTLVTSWTAAILPLVTFVLVGSAVKELAYVAFGERRSTVALDALHGFVGVVVVLYLLGGDALMAVPPLEGLDAFREPVNVFLSQLGRLVLAAIALIFGAKTLRRAVRVAQL